MSFVIFFNSLAGEDEDNAADDCRAVFAKELAVGARNLDDVEDLVGNLDEDDVDAAVPMLDVLEALTTPFFTPILPIVPEPEFEARNPESRVPMDETATAEVRDFPDPTTIEICRLPALRRLCLPDPEPAEELDATIGGASPNDGIGDLDREVDVDAIEPCGWACAVPSRAEDKPAKLPPAQAVVGFAGARTDLLFGTTEGRPNLFVSFSCFVAGMCSGLTAVTVVVGLGMLLGGGP